MRPQRLIIKKNYRRRFGQREKAHKIPARDSVCSCDLIAASCLSRSVLYVSSLTPSRPTVVVNAVGRPEPPNHMPHDAIEMEINFQGIVEWKETNKNKVICPRQRGQSMCVTQMNQSRCHQYPFGAVGKGASHINYNNWAIQSVRSFSGFGEGFSFMLAANESLRVINFNYVDRECQHSRVSVFERIFIPSRLHQIRM